MVDSLARAADKWCYLAGIAWILGFAALFVFFMVGGVFGLINDVISVFQFLCLVPVALALHRILGLHAPGLSAAAAAIGIVAMLLIALLQVLLVVGYVRFEQTLRPILLPGAIVGLWWLVTSILGLARGALPAALPGPALWRGRQSS